jgi:hypothetical protein
MKPQAVSRFRRQTKPLASQPEDAETDLHDRYHIRCGGGLGRLRASGINFDPLPQLRIYEVSILRARSSSGFPMAANASIAECVELRHRGQRWRYADERNSGRGNGARKCRSQSMNGLSRTAGTLMR